MYLYELHTHTLPCSGGGGEMEKHIDELIRRGFSGMVITNHFYRGDTKIDRSLTWEEFVSFYEKDFEDGKKYAKNKDFDLLFGVEEHISDGREALIYGITPAFLKENPSLKTVNLQEYASLVHSVGGVIYQAHPYRVRGYITKPQPFDEIAILDGIEVYNGGNDGEENDKAEAFAALRGLPMIAGSDAHDSRHCGIGGICSNVRIRDNETLVKVLKTGAYTLWKDEERRKERRG